MTEKNRSREHKLLSQPDIRSIARLVSDSQEGKKFIGEVRVKVKLTNAGDEVLVRRGLLTADKVRSYEANALVDTAAVRSVLPREVVQRLGLATVGKSRATYANDLSEDVDITEIVGIELVGRRTTEEALVLGSEVLIGQTVLESLDLQVDCTSHRVVGNPAQPDQPVIKIKGMSLAVQCQAEYRMTTMALFPGGQQRQVSFADLSGRRLLYSGTRRRRDHRTTGVSQVWNRERCRMVETTSQDFQSRDFKKAL